MGTSSSSKGPGAGVPMIPPWVPDPDAPPPTPDGGTPDDGGPTPQEAPPPLLAPPRRFFGTRLALGKFAKTGDRSSMRRSLGHYVRSGYGGSATAAKRFGGTAQTAGVLYAALAGAARGESASLPGGDLDVALLSASSAEAVINAVVEAVRPVDGTQDAEAGRAAIRDALSELLTKFPDAALLDLTEAERLFVLERYIAHDVFRRFQLDAGKPIQDKAPSIRAGLARLKEVREYVKETVSAAFRKLTTAATLTARQVARIARRALRETFGVFESYLE